MPGFLPRVLLADARHGFGDVGVGLVVELVQRLVQGEVGARAGVRHGSHARVAEGRLDQRLELLLAQRRDRRVQVRRCEQARAGRREELRQLLRAVLLGEVRQEVRGDVRVLAGLEDHEGGLPELLRDTSRSGRRRSDAPVEGRVAQQLRAAEVRRDGPGLTAPEVARGRHRGNRLVAIDHVVEQRQRVDGLRGVHRAGLRRSVVPRLGAVGVHERHDAGPLAVVDHEPRAPLGIGDRLRGLGEVFPVVGARLDHLVRVGHAGRREEIGVVVHRAAARRHRHPVEAVVVGPVGVERGDQVVEVVAVAALERVGEVHENP